MKGTVNKGFVCLLDVLGFKSLTDDQMVRVVDTLEDTWKRILPDALSAHIGNERRLETPTALLFQDTIAIAFPLTGDRVIAQTVFYAINNSIGLLYCCLLADGIKVRGAVGYGTIYVREHGVFGTAVYDASSEYERANWAGIHYTPEAAKLIAGWIGWAAREGTNVSIPYQGTDHHEFEIQFPFFRIPFKDADNSKSVCDPNVQRRESRVAIPWPKDYRLVMSTAQILGVDRRTVSTQVHAILDPELEHADDCVKLKIANTLEFCDKYLHKFPQVNSPVEWYGPLPPPMKESSS